MGDLANQLNVPSDAPVEKYRTPNVDPQFDTSNTDVELSPSGDPVNSPGTIGVTTGGTGKPISNGG